MNNKFDKLYKQIISQQFDVETTTQFNPESSEYLTFVGNDLGYSIYDVEDSYEGLREIRAIVDQQYGPTKNPWNLIAKVDGTLDHAFEVWQQYGKKQVLFRDEKLCGFGVDGVFYDTNDNEMDLNFDNSSNQDENNIITLDNSRESMQNLRNMLDEQYGPKRCPWAFTKRDADGSMNSAWKMWQYYQPQYATVENGKIVSVTTKDGTFDMQNKPC